MSFIRRIGIDLKPLREFPAFGLLYVGQFVSFLGSQITATAAPYQMYVLTNSTFWVGLIAGAQLIPMVLAGFYGGALADTLDRRRILLWTEIAMGALSVLLAVSTYFAFINPILLLVIAAAMAGLNGLHRPSQEALVPQYVPLAALKRVAPLNNLRGTFGMLLGPAVGGVLIASFGLFTTYIVDVLSFAFAISTVLRLPPTSPSVKQVKRAFDSILEGFRFTIARPVLLGSYLVDFVAMGFAYPAVLFPALVKAHWGPSYLGLFYGAIPLGAFLGSVFSGWIHRVQSYGKMIFWGAMGWCVFMVAFGVTESLWLGLGFLVLAGWSDAISAIFRSTLWNQSIPTEFRGRLAGIEMISYMSGPLIGATWIGFLAEKQSPEFAISLGGVLGVFFLILLVMGLRPFWSYQYASKPEVPQV